MEALGETLSNLGTVFTALTGHVATIADTVVSTPILFIPFGITLTYSVIRITKRLFNI